MEKILAISLKLNFTPNTLGCYGLIDSSVNYTLSRPGSFDLSGKLTSTC